MDSADTMGANQVKQEQEDSDDDQDLDGQGVEQEAGVVKEVKIKWLTDSLQSRKDVGIDKYVVYVGRKVEPPPPPPAIFEPVDEEPAKKKIKLETEDDAAKNILYSKSSARAGILERTVAKRSAEGHYSRNGSRRS